MTTPSRRFCTRGSCIGLCILSLAVLLSVSGCRSGAGSTPLGSSGLAGAIPGGDGRSLLAYRSEYRASVIQGVDSLVRRMEQRWRGRDRKAVAREYYEGASVVTPGGVLLSGRRAVADWLEQVGRAHGGFDLWRSGVAASGEMAAFFGRMESTSSGSGPGLRGQHLTVARREGREWRVRAQIFIPALEGISSPSAEGEFSDPPHITPDEIRARRSRGYRIGTVSPVAEWAVGMYWISSSTLARLRFDWERHDVQALSDLLAPSVILRLPGQAPLAGREEARTSLQSRTWDWGRLYMTVLDFDASERLAFCLGRYVQETKGRDLAGYYLAVFRVEDAGPHITHLFFTDGSTLAAD
ncbi:MAG: nuclear transport factor 2 family protein [Gemmatimonadota bacterium]